MARGINFTAIGSVMYGHFDQAVHTALRKYQFSQARLYRRLKLQQMRSGILSKNEIVMSQMVEAGQTFSSTNNVLPENSITDVGTLSSDEDVSGYFNFLFLYHFITFLISTMVTVLVSISLHIKHLASRMCF